MRTLKSHEEVLDLDHQPGRWTDASYEAEYHQVRHAALIQSELYYQLRAREAEKDLFRGLDANARVFEFGVGLGKNIALLRHKAGYDVSEFARQFCVERGIPVFSDMGDVPNHQYDVVLCSHVLEHLEDPYENLKLLGTKLKPQGTLILVLPVESHKQVPFEVDINQHLFSWNFRTINNLLQRAGFRIVQNRYRYGAGHHKLRALGWLNFRAWYLQTRLIGRLFGRRDMIVVAEKSFAV